MGSGFVLAGLLHGLAAFALFVGVLFLLLWTIRKLNEKQLKMWGIILVVGGAVVCLLTFAMAPMSAWRFGIPRAGVHMMMEKSMMDEGHGMGTMMRDDMMMEDMTMDEMVMMLDGKTGDEFDIAFTEGMIVHHQGAIDMAKAAQTSAKHAEVKTLAAEIIAAQQKEIDMMKGWLAEWKAAQ